MSPSKIEMFSICPASFQLAKGASGSAGIDAVTGTAAHEVHERCLNTGALASEFHGEVIKVDEPDKTWEIKVDDEMVHHVQESVDRCNEVGATYTFVEVRVDTSEFTPIPDQSGKSDFFAIDVPRRILYVIDFKYGKGVHVEAYVNPQLIYYALGVLRGVGAIFEIERVVIRVHQPRLDNWDEWLTTPAELIVLGRHYRRLLSRCLQPNAPFHPDPKACRFCPAKAQCPARAEHVRRMVTGMFDDLDADIDSFETPWPNELPPVDLMALEELVQVRKHSEMVTSFVKAVDKRLLRMMLHHHDVPGLKLVEGRSNRRYRDEVAAREAAAFLIRQGVPPSEVFSMSVLSPAQAERHLPKELRKEFDSIHVVKPPGRPTIALRDDRRPVYAPSAIEFDMLDDDGDDQAQSGEV